MDMSCDLVRRWLTDDYQMPLDYNRSIYHPDSLVHAIDVIKSVEAFLNVSEEQAFQFFFETAKTTQIDVFGWTDGICRPAINKASKVILDWWCEWGADIDWQLHWINIEEDFPFLLFHIEQIDKMMNERVVGSKQAFSITHLLPRGKSVKAETARSQEKRERNNLLRIIAALAIELKIPLTNPSKAGTVIAALVDKLGERLDDDTIASKVKEIQKLIKLPSG